MSGAESGSNKVEAGGVSNINTAMYLQQTLTSLRAPLAYTHTHKFSTHKHGKKKKSRLDRFQAISFQTNTRQTLTV